MESESYPVILRCKDVSVAIPVKTLIKESNIFKSMYASVQSNSDLSDSGRSSGNSSIEDIQSLAENEPADAMDDCPQSKNPGNAEASKAATTDSDGDNDTNSNKEKHQNTKETSNNPQGKNEKTNKQFDTIDLSNFNTRSVEILFISLKGFPEIIDACNSLSVLYGALKLCDEYGISSPIAQISSTFKTCDTISMKNLIEVMEIVEDIEKMINYDDISNGLFQRCVSYARWNFASWQIIMKLMNDNKTKAHLVVKILKELRDEPEAILRFKVENFSKMSEAKTSSTFIVNNLGWQIEIFPDKDQKEIGINIHCKTYFSLVCPWWYTNAIIELRMINDKKQEVTTKVLKHKFENKKEMAQLLNFSTFETVLDSGSGFVKDDLVVFEAKICVENVYSLGKSYLQDGWSSLEDETPIQKLLPDVNENDLNEYNDAPVIFCNEKSIAVVDKSILIKESSVFRAMFSEPWTRSQDTGTDDLSNSMIKQIKVTDYDPLSVKYLMEYLQGYPTLFKNCSSFVLLGDMLRLSDFYAMTRAEHEIIKKILGISINISNVVDAVEVGFKLGKIEPFKKLSSNILSRGITYLRVNLASWQELTDFAVDHENKMGAVVKIVEILAYEKVANIRLKLKEINEDVNITFSPMYIHMNMLWQFHLNFDYDKSWEDTFLYCALRCRDTNHENSMQTCNADFSANFQNFSCFDKKKVSLDEFVANKSGWSIDLIQKTKFLDPKNGYTKDGYVYLEIKLTADEPRGLPDSLGVTEEMIS